MNLLYLGTSERRIFGVYEAAASRGTRARAAVLCNPWGPEYIHAHRTLRRLAKELSLRGYHTLRFDFFGTGDSAGDADQGDIAGWELDAGSAMESVMDICGASRVALVGLRLGASIAARVAERRRDDVDALVLWDPIISGAGYLRSMNMSSAAGAGQRSVEIQGFPLTPRQRNELQTLDLSAVIAAPPVRSLVLITDRREGGDSVANSSAGSSTGPAVEYLPECSPWDHAATTHGLLPIGAIERIAQWLE